MTREEKARAYDEALKRATKLAIDEAYASQGTIAKIIFPELAESEDERRLCNLIARCIALGKQKGLVNDDDEIACLDILKRKDRSLSKYDKDMLKVIIGELEQEGKDVNVPRMYEFEINWLKSFFGLC